MKSWFKCPKCGMEWGFPDLTVEQACLERRDRCPRCGTVAAPVGEVTAPPVKKSLVGRLIHGRK